VDLRDGALVGLLEGLIVVGLVEGELDGLVVEVGWVVGGLLRERVGVGVGLPEGDLVDEDEGEVEDVTVGCWLEDNAVMVAEGVEVDAFVVAVLGLLEEAAEVGLAVGLLLLGSTTAGDAEGATLKTGLSTNCLWVTGKVGSV